MPDLRSADHLRSGRAGVAVHRVWLARSWVRWTLYLLAAGAGPWLLALATWSTLWPFRMLFGLTLTP